MGETPRKTKGNPQGTPEAHCPTQRDPLAYLIFHSFGEKTYIRETISRGEAMGQGHSQGPGQDSRDSRRPKPRQQDEMSEYETGGSSDERASSLTPGGTGGAGGTGGVAGVEDDASSSSLSSSAQVFSKIKTHFPPAKIKKIMQTDEDIGKVSQATPVITGRSLEFFIALLVDKSSKVARDQGSKRISADIMKKTILTDEKFDFLREVILPQGEGEGEGQG